jgi:hypothetical protein
VHSQIWNYIKRSKSGREPEPKVRNELYTVTSIQTSQKWQLPAHFTREFSPLVTLQAFQRESWFAGVYTQNPFDTIPTNSGSPRSHDLHWYSLLSGDIAAAVWRYGKKQRVVVEKHPRVKLIVLTYFESLENSFFRFYLQSSLWLQPNNPGRHKLDFWPPNCQIIHLGSVKPFKSIIICYSSGRKLIKQGTFLTQLKFSFPFLGWRRFPDPPPLLARILKCEHPTSTFVSLHSAICIVESFQALSSKPKFTYRTIIVYTFTSLIALYCVI